MLVVEVVSEKFFCTQEGRNLCWSFLVSRIHLVECCVKYCGLVLLVSFELFVSSWMLSAVCGLERAIFALGVAGPKSFLPELYNSNDTR